MGGPTKVNKGNMEDPQKVDRNLGSPRILESLEGLVEEASTGLETSRSKDGEVPLNHDDQQEAARMLTQRELQS